MGWRGRLERLVVLQEDQQKSREQREKALKRLTTKDTKKTKGAKKDKARKEGGRGKKKSGTRIQSLILDEELLERVQANANLFLDEGEDSPLVPVQAEKAYTELAALLAQAASAPGIYLSLCWPVGFEWVGLSHALASQTLAADSHGEHGLRMALYPAVHSTYGRYRRTRFPRERFLNEARTAINAGHDLSLRHRAFFHLRQLDSSEDPRRHPALGNAISLFEWCLENGCWNHHGPGYFSDVRLALHHARIRTAVHKRQVAKYADVMEDPDQASEAVFRIMRRTPPSKARQCLLSTQSNVDLMVIDGRQHLLKAMPSWRNALESLIEQIGTSEDAPSLVLLTDDVMIMRTFLSKLSKIGKKGKKSAATKAVYQHHWLRAQAQTWRNRSDPQAAFAPWASFAARVTSARGLAEIRAINEIARTVEVSSPELARELRRAGGFLRRLLSLPVGQRLLRQQLGEQAEQLPLEQGKRLLARYCWVDYAREMRVRLAGTSAGDSTSLDRALKKSQGIVKTIEDMTSVQQALLDVLLEKAVEDKRTLVLVEEKRLVPFLRMIIQEELGEIQEDLVRFEVNIDAVSFEALDAFIVAGASKERIEHLLVTRELPNDVTFILDAYSGWQIQRDLDVLVEMDAYAPILPRIEALLGQIRPHLLSFEQLAGDLDYFAELGEGHSVNGAHHDHEIVHYANIHLGGYGIVPVGKSSTLLKANPAKEPMFLATTVDELTEGDWLVVLDEEHRDRIADLLRVQASRLTEKAESFLKVYFQQALASIQTHYLQPYCTQRARAVLARMREIDVDLARTIREERVTAWVRHIERFDLEEKGAHQGELKSGSPRYKEEFLLFAESFGMPPPVAEKFWQEGIWRLRVLRILEGRKLGRQIQRVLTGFFSFSEIGLDKKDIEELFALVKSQVYPISMILCVKDEQDEEEPRS